MAGLDRSIPRGKLVRASADRLRRLLDFFDRLTGTLEPLHRRLILYGQKELRIAASDGFLTAEVRVPWLPVSPGRHVLSLDLDPIRGFLKEAEGDVQILFHPEAVRFTHGGDALWLEPKRLKEVLFLWPEPEHSVKVSREALLGLFDFSSVHLVDGDAVLLSVLPKRIVALGSGSGLSAAAVLEADTGTSTALLFPYASSRHLVKALAVLREGTLTLGFLQGRPLIEAAGVKIGTLGDPEPGHPGDPWEELHRGLGPPEWAAERDLLKGLLLKLSRVERQEGARTFLELYANRIEGVVRTPQGEYRSAAGIRMARNPVRAHAPVMAERLRRLLVRFRAERVSLHLTPLGLLITDAASRAVLIEGARGLGCGQM